MTVEKLTVRRGQLAEQLDNANAQIAQGRELVRQGEMAAANIRGAMLLVDEFLAEAKQEQPPAPPAPLVAAPSPADELAEATVNGTVVQPEA